MIDLEGGWLHLGHKGYRENLSTMVRCVEAEPVNRFMSSVGKFVEETS